MASTDSLGLTSGSPFNKLRHPVVDRLPQLNHDTKPSDPLALPPKLLQRGVRRALTDVVAGRRPSAPVVVELDPTSFCDLACPECISSPLLNKQRFSKDQLVSIAHEMVDAEVRAVILIGGGEPLLHNAIGQVITLLGTAGMAVGITTNGTLIDRYLDPIARYASWTRVSVDAATQETYDQFRPSRTGRSSFPSVIDNLKLLSDRKSGTLGFSFLILTRRNADGDIMATNAHEIFLAAQIARDIGCDYFEIKPEYDMGHYLRPRNSREYEGVREEIERAEQLSSPDFSVYARHTLLALETETTPVQPKRYDSCAVAELRTLITPTGAYICPYHRGNATASYGNPAKDGFSHVWTSDRRRQVMKQVQPSRDCQFHCIRHESNLLIEQVRDSGIESYEESPDYDFFI